MDTLIISLNAINIKVQSYIVNYIERNSMSSELNAGSHECCSANGPQFATIYAKVDDSISIYVATIK